MAGVTVYIWILTGCRNELLVVAHSRVVGKGVGDHGGRLAMSIVCVCCLCWYVARSTAGWE